MINLKRSAAAIIVVLTTAAFPINVFAEEANFGLLGEIFGSKTPSSTTPSSTTPSSTTPATTDTAKIDDAAKSAENTTDSVPVKFKGHKVHAAALRGAPSANIKALIAQHAAANGVPLALADAIVRIESRYNPRATNHGAMGLMQIKTQTARGVGFSGSSGDLLNADINLRFGMKYLAQVYNMSGGNVCSTVMRYQTGVAATHLSAANRAYCAKAKAIIASL